MTRSRRSGSGRSRGSSPTFGTVPGRGPSWGPQAAELIGLAGFELLDWQRDTLTEWLQYDRRSEALKVTAAGLCLPRRNGKTALLLARMVFGIFVLGESRVSYTAQDNRTAFETFESMCEIVERDPFRRYVDQVRKANGQQRIDFRFPDGRRARFVPSTRTGSAGRGLETDLLVLDEAMYLDAEIMAALTPLVARAQAGGRGQIIAASSAGTMESEVWLGMRDRGRALHGQAGSVSWREWCARDDEDPEDHEGWFRANPSLGTSILGEAFLESQRIINTPEAFAREHLGKWGEANDLPAVDLDKWQALAVSQRPDIDTDRGVWLSFDIDHGRTCGRIILAGKTPQGKVAIQVVESWDDPLGINETRFAHAVARAAEKYAPEEVVYDRLTGEDVSRYVESLGHRRRALPLPQYAAACSMLRQAVNDGRIVHDGSESLLGDLSRAVPKVYNDGGFTLSRLKASTGPIAGAIALALAYYVASNPDDSDDSIAVA